MKGFPSHFINLKKYRPCSFLSRAQRSLLFPLISFGALTLKNTVVGNHINCSDLSSSNTVVISKMLVTLARSCHHSGLASQGRHSMIGLCTTWYLPTNFSHGPGKVSHHQQVTNTIMHRLYIAVQQQYLLLFAGLEQQQETKNL